MPEITFGTDGIRGTAGEWPMDAAGALAIGQGLGKYLRETGHDTPKVLIGRDTRISGDVLATALASGLLSYGVDVADGGVIPTAGAAFLTKAHTMDAGIVISASHNPWTENGIKVIGPQGFKLDDEVERAIERHIATAAQDSRAGILPGHLSHHTDWAEEYIAHLVAPFRRTSLRGLSIALDCSNGAASRIAPACFERLGAAPTVIAASPDGTNINNACGSEELRAGASPLMEIQRTQKPDLCAAFDGDADRVALLDERGALLDGDHILYILAKDLRGRGKLNRETVVTTQMANRGLDHALAADGIAVVRTRVGDRYIIQEIRTQGYVLGGEQSGHVVIYDSEHTTGDGIYTALRIACLMAEQSAALHELAAPLKKFPQVIASAHVSTKPDLDETDSIADARQALSERLGDGAAINIRYSGTEPLVRVMIEGTLDHSISHLAQQAVRLCRVVQAAAATPNGRIEVKDCATGVRIDPGALE